MVDKTFSVHWRICSLLLVAVGCLVVDIKPADAQFPNLPGTGSYWVKRNDGRSPGEMPAYTTIGYTNYMSSIDDTGRLFPAGQPWVLILNAETFYTDERSGGGNVGMHTRREFGRFTVGAGFSYDVTQSRANNVF